MRFATLSILLHALALGYVSAQEVDSGPHNNECGVASKSLSNLTFVPKQRLTAV